jgi:flagellar basal body-associated protein FliL
MRSTYSASAKLIIIIVIIIIIIIIVLTAVQFSLRSSCSYTSTDKTNNNKHT